ncbi:MAG: hypothetical protein R3B70_06825 [Polyangiaceae bacterium]
MEHGSPGYAGVRFEGVYRGIDVVYREREGRLAYDLELSPGRTRRAFDSGSRARRRWLSRRTGVSA